MAGKETFEEEFLTCCICTEIYADPCTLRCEHSLCRKCVTSLLTSGGVNATRSHSIRCPMCRQDTPVPNPQSPTAQWAKQIRPSRLLTKLIDRHKSLHNIGEGEDICHLCKGIGETTLALSWCSDCEMTLCRWCSERHQWGPTTKNHELFNLSQGSAVKERKKIKCKEHESERVTFICIDCKTAVCQTCCLLKHAKHNFVSFQSMLPEITKTLKPKRRLYAEKMIVHKSIVEKAESMIERFQSCKATTEVKIKSTISSVIRSIQDEEKDLLKELDEVSSQISQHQTSVKSDRATAQMYQQHGEFIAQALESESAVDMYDMYQVCLSLASESVDRNSESDKEWAINEMGDNDFMRDVFPSRKPLTLHRPYDIIDIKHAEDVRLPDPCNIIVLTVNCTKVLVVADWKNRCLKAVLCKGKTQEISRVELSNQPYRITKITGNTLASTVKGSHIVLVEVQPELILNTKIPTRKQYISLTSLSGSKLAASSYTSETIDILDLTGNVLKSISSENIIQPFYLCTTHDDNILVADNESIYLLTTNGDLVFSYSSSGDRAVRYPGGITVTDTGDILFADWASRNIIQLSSDGSFIGEVLSSADGIGKPCGLCFDENNHLYVCDRLTGQESVKMFTFE